MKPTKTLIATLPAAFALSAFGGIEDRTEARTFTGASGTVFRYRWAEKTPTDGSPVPLVFFFHGAGERGDNNVSQLHHGVADIVAWLDANEAGFKFVAGQVPVGKRWVEVDWGAAAHTMPAEPSETMGLALELLDTLLADPTTDTNRVYATGISMGGYGTWDIICRRPEVFAAALPICGGADVAQASRIASLPIWTFHGSKDTSVPVVRSRSILIALWQAGSDAHYREYPDAPHDVWTRTYRDSEVLSWFFSQTKDGSSVPVTPIDPDPSGGADSPIRLESDSFTLQSTALAATTLSPSSFTIASAPGSNGLDRILVKCGGMAAHLDIGEFVREGNALLDLHNADGKLGAVTPGTAQSANITVQGGVAAIGGGAAGTPSVPVVPWARGSLSATLDNNYFTQLVTYDATKGFRFLDSATEYETITAAPESPYEPTNGVNLRVTASGTVEIAGGCTVNSFSMLSPNAANVTVSGGPMRIGSGVLDMSVWNNVTLTGDFDFGETTAYITQCANKSATLYGSIAGRDVVFGDNVLAPAGGNAPLFVKSTGTFTGDLYINGLASIDTSSFLPSGERKGNVYVNGKFLPNGGTVNGLFGSGLIDKSYSGTATLTIGDNDADGDFGGEIKNSKGAFNFTKTGSGTQRLGGPVTIGGDFKVNGGTVLLDGTLSAKSVTVANGAALVIDLPEAVAAAEEAVKVVMTTTAMVLDSFTNGDHVASLELRNDGTELWATGKALATFVLLQ